MNQYEHEKNANQNEMKKSSRVPPVYLKEMQKSRTCGSENDAFY